MDYVNNEANANNQSYVTEGIDAMTNDTREIQPLSDDEIGALCLRFISASIYGRRVHDIRMLSYAEKYDLLPRMLVTIVEQRKRDLRPTPNNVGVYLLQNCSSGYLGNSPVFWKKGGCGYTQWIDEAERWTKEDAECLIRSTSGTHSWRMWSLSDIEASAKRTVDIQDLRSRAAIQLTEWGWDGQQQG